MSRIFIIGIALLVLILIVVAVIIIKKSAKKQSVSITSNIVKEKFSLASLFSNKELNDEFYASLEKILIKGDVGYDLTKDIITKLRQVTIDKNITNTDLARNELREILISCFSPKTLMLEKNTILFIVGVNGVGKTTSIAKLANYIKNDYSVLLAAADTFRAAAIEQLETWAKRIGIAIVKGQQGGDPASVIFDAINKAKSNDIDIIIVDTAGRFHNQDNLIKQLEKMKRIATERFSEYKFIPILILDANVGQNGIEQAKVFSSSLDVDGVVLAKLDSSAKGGVALSVNYYMSLPIFFYGNGEKLENIQEFSIEKFVDSILTNT